MNVGRFPMRLKCSLLGLVVALSAPWTSGAVTHEDETHGVTPQHHTAKSGHRVPTSAFVKVVRDSTRRFHNVSVALAEGYAPQFGCVSGSHEGAMGVHLVNGALVADAALDPTRPELLVYEPMPNGRLRLVAADYLVLRDAWHTTNPAAPELMGQLFHLFEEPNRFNLPAFYTLHVWAWEENPQGTFANWNPRVSCDAYDGENP